MSSRPGRRPTPDAWPTPAQRLEAGALRVVAALLRLLPLSVSSLLGQMVGGVLHALDGRHRRRVQKQIRDALGDSVSEAEARRLTRAMYRHFGIMLAEFVRIPSVTAGNLSEYVDWRGGDAYVRDCLREGRGVILATGHVGNWEMAGAAFALAGLSAGAVARPLDNPLLDRYVNTIRQESGQRIFAKFGALRAVLSALRDDEGVGILVDQDAGQRGVFVPFFGSAASTIPTPADLAIRTAAPIVVVSLQRVGGPMRFQANVSTAIRARADADPESERLRLLTAVNRELEAQIRQAPEQWLWLHRRWKTRPPAESEATPD